MSSDFSGVSLLEPEPLLMLREATKDYTRASSCSAPEQVQLLHLMALLLGAKKTIEIGVFMGYSSGWVALALPPKGKMVACESSRENESVARRTWRDLGVEKKIDFRLGPALQTLDVLLADGQAGTFDLIYIDADKTNYLNYYERGLLLLRQGGLVAADNVLWHRSVVDLTIQDA